MSNYQLLTVTTISYDNDSIGQPHASCIMVFEKFGRVVDAGRGGRVVGVGSSILEGAPFYEVMAMKCFVYS